MAVRTHKILLDILFTICTMYAHTTPNPLTKMTQHEILLLAIEAANLRVFQARYAYEHSRTQKTIDALAEAERLVEQLEHLFLNPNKETKHA